jgi:hypothetical protein
MTEFRSALIGKNFIFLSSLVHAVGVKRALTEKLNNKLDTIIIWKQYQQHIQILAVHTT